MARRSNDGAGLILLVGGVLGFFWSLLKYPIPTVIAVNVATLIFFPDYFGGVFAVSLVAGLLYFAVKQSAKQAKQRQLDRKFATQYGTATPNKSKPLIERNEDIVQACLGGIRKDSWSYYVENKVRDCLGEIAQREGQPQLGPGPREWLSVWQRRTGLTQEWLDLKAHVLNRFKTRYQEILDEEERQREKKHQEILQNNTDLVEKFFEIAERKVSVIDDYGDENWNALPKEIENCISKLESRIPGLSHDYSARVFLQKELDQKFRIYHAAQKDKPTSTENVNGLSGVEFETYLVKVLKENGFEDVRGTPATGDQGADLIARRNGKTIIIQAKRYQGAVGNRAVQEVMSAVQYYGGDEGWVITNSVFTPSARALAQKGNVKLIDGTSLNRIGKYLN
jgi:HJR/Mrr/RecB family endonuclease